MPALAGALSIALLTAGAAHVVAFDAIDAAGFITGALCVWFAVRENVWNWPLGIANNALYVVIFARSRLFADMSLQIAFAVLGVAGWILWLRRSDGGETLVIRRVPAVQAAGLLALGMVATVLWTHYLTTAFSLIAQYLLTRKYRETWPVWIAVNAVSIGLYAWKGLPLSAALYAIFLGMCVAGMRMWWKADLAPAIRTAGARPTRSIEP